MEVAVSPVIDKITECEQGYVERLYVVSGNLLVIKDVCRTIPKKFIDTVRGQIKQFSRDAAARMRRYLRTCIAIYIGMVTLTYPQGYPTNGRVVKEHLRRFLQECRRYQARRAGGDDPSWSAFWFLEFQARGAPHYHVFLSHLPPKDWVSATWYRIVNSEDDRHLRAGTRTERLRYGRGATVSYASKYATKAAQKDIPPGYENCGRFWGVWGEKAIVEAITRVRHNRRGVSVVEREQELMEKLVDMKGSGDIKVLSRDNGLLIAEINTDLAMRAIKRQLLKIDMAVATETPSSSYLQWLFRDAELDP